MDIIEQIKNNFNRGFFGKSMPIDLLPEEYPAWTFKQKSWVGVAVPIEKYQPFSEKFSKMRISTEHDVLINDIPYDILMITCNDMEIRNEFATVCANFVDPGEDGSLRKMLINDPVRWWKHWKTLLGNVSSDRSPYDILGELLMLEKAIASGDKPHWSGADHATHDIETDEYSVEVKSTTSRYGYEATISSIYQLKPAADKPLYLSYLRFEPSGLGQSINDVARRLKRLGYYAAELEAALAKSGLEQGRTARNDKYKVIEWKKYSVDDRFPSVTESSFKNDRLPQNVVKFTYTVDLSGLEGESLL